MITVHQLGLAYVKATRFLNPQRVAIDAGGIRHDRLFALVEADGKFINSDSHAGSIPLQFDYAAAAERSRCSCRMGDSLKARPTPTARPGPSTTMACAKSMCRK